MFIIVISVEATYKVIYAVNKCREQNRIAQFWCVYMRRIAVKNINSITER